ncbi:amino acid ABC transporter substrate-binding protein [Streptomyces sp. NPDC088387]|uniref:amino acid ABC transporter substrate-binding protein n=1 Tax=Streptomyces sp. NPDC088387 TaxID=3365859 RepID=UPI0038225F90
MPTSPQRRRLMAVATVSCLLLVTAACGSGAGSDSNGPIKIGASLPLTGEFSQPGQAAKRGYQVWQEMINKQGGLLGRKVQLVIKDDGSNQNAIVADYNALISQDKVELLLGTFSSLLNLPASAVAERNQMLYIEPAGGSPEMFSRGFKYLFFSQQATADKQGAGFANWIAGLPAAQRPRTAAYPAIDDPFAGPTADGVRKILEKAGVRTVYRKTYAIDTKNFDSIAGAMKAAAPDLVVNGAQFEDGVGLVRSMVKAGFKPKWLYQTTAPSLGTQYAKAVGPENTEGVMFAISHAVQAKTPGNQEFVDQYRAMFKDAPPEDAADAYAAGQILQAAVEQVGNVSEQGRMADWLRANDVQTILGKLGWNDDGSPTGSFLTGQWQNGQVQIVLPANVATTSRIVQGWKPGGTG